MSNYSVKVQYQQLVNKKMVKVINQHVLTAVSVTDAEVKVAAYMQKSELSDYAILSCSQYKLTDVIIDKHDDDNKWHQVKVSYEIENDNGKIQKTYENNLIYTENVKRAYEIMEHILGNTSLNWCVDSVTKTSIHAVDVENVKEVSEAQ